MQEKPDLPPILPDIQNLLTEYLICPERLPIHEYERNQEFWPRVPDVTELFYVEDIACGTTLKVQRDLNTGKIIEFREVPITEVGLHAKNSMSLNRAPAPYSEGVRGDPTHFPFWPGGFPDPVIQVPEAESIDSAELLTIPPGFEKGMCFEDDGFTVISDFVEQTNKSKKVEISNEEDSTVNLMSLIKQEQDFLSLWKDNINENGTNTIASSDKPNIELEELEILPIEPVKEIPILNISKMDDTTVKTKKYNWAVMIDIQQPVSDFHERIPELAHEYPFELDAFQKQAILKLEENCDVFVAAHTSAGKTVVAEYAIALSQKHKTRTIYTSPIKALSNQKYRDFKKTFENVGLITGDFQINQTGVCLIMTTEILRSMLYCGSEVIRDLEYVIFDEVHYINDAERGHVWEEVLILLPAHVRIVLLSATVPNTMEFANWLGMTKKRKVYVISTLYRPVPLQHYLYTGSGGKSMNERFLIVDAEGNFISEGYAAAMEAIQSRKPKGGPPKFIPSKDKIKQEATALMVLIDHLQRNDLLPVVAFTFSRDRCDKMAASLKSVDLTTAKEKHKIHVFYQECIKRLKEPDQNLPQVMIMREILKNGIGVHHSGILPIIKEIVEMLFQSGCVKVLFATETFSMGVNMPARTVVFNNIVKWDGFDRRFLKPAEYIQMAGRAGRRGLDSTGTVIIRCSDEVPDIRSLKEMMLGKPQVLKSQFRLTYNMLLSLLRAESFTVESMMTHSFYEVGHVIKADQLKIKRNKIQSELETECAKELSEHLQHLFDYYKVASEYIKEFKCIQPKLISQAQVIKELTPGRVLLISHGLHFKKLALLLAIKKDHLRYKVLVQCNQSKENLEENQPEDWYRMLSFTYDQVFQPEGAGGHIVLDISAIDIIEISNKTIKIDCDLIIKDWEKRQIPRFKDDPPGQTCQQAIQELAKLTNSVLSGCTVNYLNPTKDYKINDINLLQDLICLNLKRDKLMSQVSYTKIANFEEQFQSVFKRKYLEDQLEELNFEISGRSLQLYPEYMSRIDVLKELRYIDKENKVQMKGRVACEMGMNELLITELVFNDTLTNLQAAEVAALLSALVFQVKAKEQQTFEQLPDVLKKGMKEISEINTNLQNLEKSFQINSTQEDLNFGLVEVVYEWAREKPFADIMKLTEVQEGIIVRCIQQLNETLKDVRDAARIIGSPVLQAKMEEASNVIKRDIVFAASLYTQKEAINLN